MRQPSAWGRRTFAAPLASTVPTMAAALTGARATNAEPAATPAPTPETPNFAGTYRAA